MTYNVFDGTLNLTQPTNDRKTQKRNLQLNIEKIGEGVLKLLSSMTEATVTEYDTEANTNAWFNRHDGFK